MENKEKDKTETTDKTEIKDAQESVKDSAEEETSAAADKTENESTENADDEDTAGSAEPSEEIKAEENSEGGDEAKAEESADSAVDTEPAEITEVTGDEGSTDTDGLSEKAEDETSDIVINTDDADKTQSRKWIILPIAALAGVIYIPGVVHYSNNFLPNTYISGENVSEQNIDDYVRNFDAGYPETITVKEKDGSEFNLSLKGMVRNHDVSEIAVNAKNSSWLWIFKSFAPEKFTPGDDIDLDQEAFLKEAEAVVINEERTDPQNAYFDPATLSVVPELEGTKIDLDMLTDTISDAAGNKQGSVVLADEYVQAEIKSDDESIQSIVSKMDTLLPADGMNIAIAGNIVKNVTHDEMKNWLAYTDGEFSFDQNKVYEYAVQLDAQYTTDDKKRKFTTSGGVQIEVGGNAHDNYQGFELNIDETANNIFNALSEGRYSAECVFDRTGYAIDENGDIGGTYIEISIADQHMWFYKDYSLVLDTDVVTGLLSMSDRNTPRGLFNVLEMRSPYVMHGSYGSQPCQYFIRVTWDGVAIHDADWQSSFGGNIYTYRGSHGCINTPHAIVARLWDELDALDNYHVPIIIY